MNRKQELQNIISQARQELGKIEDQERYDRDIQYVGKYYKIRNNFSCPKEEKDYWWFYMNIYCMGENDELLSFNFEKTSENKINIDTREYASLYDGWIEITKEEFWEAWEKLMSDLQSCLPPHETTVSCAGE